MWPQKGGNALSFGDISRIGGISHGGAEENVVAHAFPPSTRAFQARQAQGASEEDPGTSLEKV